MSDAGYHQPMEIPAPSPVLPEAIRRFLEPPRFATISTINPDGAPHQAVVWYALDGDRLLINSRPARRWPQNLERDPRIGIAIYDDADPEHWISLRGTAERLRDGNAASEDIAALARRYGSDPEKFLGIARVTFRVRIERTFEYGP